MGPPLPIGFDDPPASTGASSSGPGSIPFMTFQSSSFDDLHKASAHTSHYSLPQGQMAAASGFEEEPPLLEELGIDPALVVRKSMQVGHALLTRSQRPTRETLCNNKPSVHKLTGFRVLNDAGSESTQTRPKTPRGR